MEILSVTLRNFKSHSDRQYFFQPGTNAICGENGAGKTTILEAIAWTLFNYRGAYTKEDLIRNGAGSAQARVSFISNRDGRTYEVERCTNKGYTLYDPQLGVRLDYRHIEEEVLPWLRQQFGVAPGTDLARLFANTIGVPQGMFTADFLQSPEKRKPIFDAILKVEEYRLANQQMLSLEKYGKAEAEKHEVVIAQYNDTLKEWEPLHHRQTLLTQEITQQEEILQQLQGELTQLQAEKDRLSTQAQQVQQITTQLQQVNLKLENQQQNQIRTTQAVQRSQTAVAICTEHRPSYQAVRQAEAALETLDQQVKQRQSLLKQREKQQANWTAQQTSLTRLNLQLEQLAQAEAEITALQPLIDQQVALEQQQAQRVEQLNQLQATKSEQKNLTRQLTRLQTQFNQLGQEITRIAQLGAEAQQIEALEQKRDRLQQQLSRVEAAQQFESELRQLVSTGEDQRDRLQLNTDEAAALLSQLQQAIPNLATTSVQQLLTTLKSGVSLNTDLLNALWRILADLSEQISEAKLQRQLQQLKAQLETAYRARAEWANLEARQVQQAELQTEVSHIQQQIQQLQQQLATEPELQQQRSHFLQAIAQLADPRGRAQLLTQNLKQRAALNQQYATLNQQCETIQQAIATLDQQLVAFADLEEQIDAQKQIRQIHQENFLLYLQHQNDANQLRRLDAELQEMNTQLQQIQAEQYTLQEQSDRLLQDYDPQQYKTVEAHYVQIRSQADQVTGSLPQQRKRLIEISTQIANLQDILEKRDRTEAELKQKEKVKRFINFARKVYKEAAPRITQRYVQSISYEADRLFRELMNRPNVALEWTKEYDIVVQEGAHTRRFINLSGGEQMCAALAVRLALLRVLADIDIAFFDEPTTNMDRPRRESLAEAIANIKSFKQLFVISHDDTFEKVTENVIIVNRE
ncbi:MAG: SMC family ATPase [Oculatellaceae cyanobacterium Prado106]|nr:SMC family ATPase [Oculatellaceae cyanobacterium Prado106]